MGPASPLRDAAAGEGIDAPAEVEVLQRNPLWLLAAFVPLVVVLLGVVGALPLLARGRLEVLIATWVLAVVGFVAAAIWLERVRRRDPQPLRRRQPLELDEEAIRIGDRAIPRAAIAHAAFAASPHPHVRLTLRGAFPEHVRLAAVDAEDGRRLIEALQLDEAHTSATFVASPPLAASWLQAGGVIAAMLGAIAVASLGGTVPMLLVAMLFTAGIAAPQRVEVGVDGLHTRWLLRERFVPWHDVEEVHVEPGMGQSMQVVVEMQRLPAMRIVLQQSNEAHSPAQALRERIERARAAHDAGEAAEEGMLARPPDLAPKDWLARLRALREVTAPRRAAVDAERLWRLVETPRVAPRIRVAAAVALHEDARHPEARRRIGEIARQAAQPGLRVALEAFDEGDDDALLEALASLEASESQAP